MYAVPSSRGKCLYGHITARKGNARTLHCTEALSSLKAMIVGVEKIFVAYELQNY